MKVQSLALAASILPASFALQLAPRSSSSSPRVVSLDIQRRHVENPGKRDRLRRRDKTLTESLDNLETLYFANASIGTPSQSLRLHLDTGSSDLWTNAASSDLCQSRGSPCAQAGTYSANDSSTYKFVNSDFNISYVDGSGAVGDYVTDTLHFGGMDISDMQFGIGYTSSSPEGILGIGYTVNEVQVNRAGLKAYANLPQKLADSGVINSNAYSLYLNDLDAGTGSILFGGVDTDKYHGSLQTLPIIAEDGVYAEFIIALTGMKLGSSDLFTNQDYGVLLDSGSSLIYLPDSVAENIYNQLGAQYDESSETAIVDCSLRNNDSSMTFTFSGVDITVDMSELVLTESVERGQETCILGISPAGDSTSVLGDTFLRSAYVVYDLDNNNISLAQTNFNATDSSVQEITTGTNAVPDATGVANAVSSVAVGTGGARNGQPTGVSSAGAAAAMMTPPPAFYGAAAAVGAGLLYAL